MHRRTSNTDSRPNPDPTALTTTALEKAIKDSNDLTQTKFDARDARIADLKDRLDRSDARRMEGGLGLLIGFLAMAVIVAMVFLISKFSA